MVAHVWLIQYMLHFPNPGNKIMLIRFYTAEKEQGDRVEDGKNIHSDKCGHINR